MSETLKVERATDKLKREVKVRTQSSRRTAEPNSSTASMSKKKKKFFDAREMIKQGNAQGA